VENYTRKPNTTCSECGESIYRRPFQINRGPVFCSTACSNIRNKIIRICPECKSPIDKKSSGKVYCSRTCSNKGRTGLKYKIGSPNDKALKIRKLKKLLIEDRGPKCEICGFEDTRILQVHHLLERCNGGTDSLDNLKLICPNCHCSIHYTDG
jgi:5-methylcytosine-specific restriction endonuclease McrA